MKSRLSLPLLSLGVGFCLACGGITDDLTDKMGEEINEEIAEKLVEMAVGGDVEVNDDGTVSIELDGVKLVSGEGQKVPDGFPFPPPESANVMGVTQLDQGDEHIVALVVQLGEGGAEAVEEIQRLVVADGWTIETSQNADVNGAKMRLFLAKKEGQTLSVSVHIADGEAAGTWTWTKTKDAAE